MKLIKKLDKHSKKIEMQIKMQGNDIVNLYDLDTGCKVIYTVANGRKHVSISNSNRKPTIEEIGFVVYELMQGVENLNVVPPRELRNEDDMYIVHLMEKVENKVLN